jgi:5-methylcytosine-specific restriction endonuclease McrA
MSNYKTKACQLCGKEYHPTDSMQKYCTECGPVARAEKARASVARWQNMNPEKVRASSVRWHKANPEKVRVSTAERRKAHPEKHRASNAKWAKANPEKAKVGTAKWQKENPEKKAVWGSKRRAAKYANTPINELLTSSEWLAILAEAGGHCAYCGKEAKLTLDHVIPLSKGGQHSAPNVVPACARCNSSKGSKTLEEWQAKRQREVASA